MCYPIGLRFRGLINIGLGRPLKKLPETLDLDLSASTAQDLYDLIAKHTRLNRNRLRITKGSDGKPVQLKRDDGKLVTIEETGLRNGSQIFVKDLGMSLRATTVYVLAEDTYRSPDCLAHCLHYRVPRPAHDSPALFLLPALDLFFIALQPPQLHPLQCVLDH